MKKHAHNQTQKQHIYIQNELSNKLFSIPF